jgi:hypothetical protein
MALGNNAIQVLLGTVVDDLENLYANTLSSNTTTYAGPGASNYGYHIGGNADPAPPYTFLDTIDRFPYATSIANAADVGNLTVLRKGMGVSSAENGYYMGGHIPTANTRIDRFTFSSSITNAAVVGSLSVARGENSGAQSIIDGYGYSMGGVTTAWNTTPVTASNIIDRFPFALSITNATDVGDLSVSRGLASSQYSPTHGYTSGGAAPPAPLTLQSVIDRFPFALSITNAADVGDLSYTFFAPAGLSSAEYGYTAGGSDDQPTPSILRITYFPFALSITNAASSGNLSSGRIYGGTQSMVSHGYVSGGSDDSPGVWVSNIERFPFASVITNGASVGNLTQARETRGGAQY